MSQISPPIRILLVCAVAFMAAWMLFLRPKDDAGTPAAATPAPAQTRPVDAGGEQAQSLAGKAVEKANEATAAQDAQAEQLAGGAGETAATPSSTATSPTSSTPTATAATSKDPGQLSDAKGLPLRVLHALADRKVVALLFWSPKSADDKLVRKSLSGIDRHHGKVMAHATNIKKISAYQQITRGANVEQSPTIVVIDRNRKVDTLVGFVDRRSIDQAVTDALRSSK